MPPHRGARQDRRARADVGGLERRPPDRGAGGSHFASYATRINAISANLAPRRRGSGRIQRPGGGSHAEGNGTFLRDPDAKRKSTDAYHSTATHSIA